MSSSAAKHLLSISFAEPDLDHMNLLSERAREDSLTREDITELDQYLWVGTLLSILQSRAQRVPRA